jgi:hypothetical protein
LISNHDEALVNGKGSDSNNNSCNNVNNSSRITTCNSANNMISEHLVNNNACNNVFSGVAEGASEKQKSSESQCELELGHYVSVCALVSGEGNDRRPDINCLQSSVVLVVLFQVPL